MNFYKIYIYIYLKYLLFYKYICKTYILADISWNCIYIGTKTTYDIYETKKVLFLNLKDSIFSKYICKMYISADM